jgi:hypothetical protein
MRLRDPGSGMEKIRIRDKHPGFATLEKSTETTLIERPVAAA